MRRHQTLFFASALTLVSIAGPGCDSPGARYEIARRESNLRRTFAMMQEIEDRRPANLARTFAVIDDQHQRDIRNTEQNRILLEQWPNEEVRRWESRRTRREEGLHDVLKGNPANIERTWPRIVY